MRFWKKIASIFALVVVLSLPLAGLQAQEPPAHVTLQGVVRTSDNVPVPGASIHIVEQISGKSWVTWTDEQGKFRLPELPGGKFRVEATQIGFGLATVEVTPTSETGPDIILNLHVATVSEIAAANATATSTPVPTAPSNTPPNPDNKGQAATTNPPPTTGAQTGTGKKPGITPTTTARGGRSNQPGQGQQGGRGGGRGFQQVDVSGQGGTDPTDPTGAVGAGDPLGGTQAATADAVLASGTIAQGFSGGGFNMQFGGGFDQNNGNASQAGQTGILNAGGGELPGGAPGGFQVTGGGGGRGGPGGGGPGGGGPGGGGRGGGGGGGGGDRGGRGGGRGGAQGANGPPWGLSNVIRKRINSMHYTLNETLADSAFDANNWSATGTVQPKVPWVTNNFGGSLGGPFRIPKVYDGRDKTYFFINANFGHGTTGVNNYSNVPTAEERLGDFCNSAGGKPLILYDFTSNFNGPRTPLDPKVVPGSCNLDGINNLQTGKPYINPAATALLAFVPSPNLPAGLQYNYLLQTTTPTNSQAINLRVNQTISPKLNLGVVYNIRQGQSSGQGSFPLETTTASSRGQNVVLTLNHNISTRLINSIALNFSRQRTSSQNGFANLTNVEGSLGITGVSSNPLNWGLPGISFNPSGGLPYTGFNDSLPTLRKNETWNLSDTLSLNLPKHTLRFGFTYRRVQLNNVADPNPRGSFSFNGLMSENFIPNGSGGFKPDTTTGSPIADFLMGLPAGTNVRFGDTANYLRTYGFIAYVGDDWHVYPRLTVTYGLRYELMLPPTELFGHIANLDVSPTFNQVSLVVPCTSGITPCGTGQFSGTLPNSLIHANYLNFAPRVSIAWRVPGKWFDANNGRHALVIRAGYSVVDITSTYNGLDSSLLNQPPFATVASFSTSPTQLLTLQNGFPSASQVNTIAVNPNYKNPYTQIWNFSLESQIIDGLVWQLTYVGTKGTHLDLLTAPNVLSTTSPALLGQSIPQNLTYTFDTSGGNLEYNGMQARLQKRMRNGFTFTALYTFSKSIDDSSSIGGSSGTIIQQFPLFHLERGLSTFDTRHSITGNSTFELPFGQRKRWAHTGTPARLLSNFRLSGSATFHTGTPLTPIVQGELTQYASGNFQTRPDILAGCNPNLPSGQQSVTGFINTTCFAAPGAYFPTAGCDQKTGVGCITAPGTLFGDLGRDTITGPSMFNVNMALQRTITLDRDGQKHLDLRWEVNNLANHPNWSGLGLVVGTRNFGQITGAGGMRTMTAVIRLNF